MRPILGEKMTQLSCNYSYYGDNIVLERIDDGSLPFKGFKYILNDKQTTKEEFDRIKKLTYLAIEKHCMLDDDDNNYEESICYKNNNSSNSLIVKTVNGIVVPEQVELKEYLKDKLC